MAKKKKAKNKTILNIPAVGLQTAHFKAKSRLRPRIPQPDIQVVHESARPPPGPDRGRAPVSVRLGPVRAAGMPILPPGVHCKMSQFTAKNYSTCRPCGLPQMPGICPMCNEYYFDVTPHMWSFHELDLTIAQRLVTTGSV